MALNSSAQGAGSTAKTTNTVDHTLPFTTMGWVYLVDNTPGNIHYAFVNSNATNTDYSLIRFFNNGSGVPFVDMDILINSVESNQTGTTAITLNTWFHAAIVRTSDTQVLGYLNGSLEVTFNHASVTGRPHDYQTLVHYLQGSTGCYKSWQAALSAAEIFQEYQTIRPIRFDNLNAWLPTFPGVGERTRDYSGFGPDFTETGTITDVNSPPVSYGAPGQLITAVSQFARPGSDISAGGWTTSPLFSKINESPFNDSDLIQSGNSPSADVCEVQLGTVSDPISSTGHTVRYRARKAS